MDDFAFTAGRQILRQWIRDILELFIIPLLTVATYILWDMNKNINTLNLQVGVIIAERAVEKDGLKELKDRVNELEKRSRR